jgi:putative heme-binding domain-containing protein
MLRLTSVSTAAVTLLAGASLAARTDGQAGAARAGAALYAAECADCHGADATGARGPDLTRLWSAGPADERVARAIRAGIPGSIMPPSTASDAEIRALTAYLKDLGTAAPSGIGRGNAERGEELFWSTCGGCHRIGARGGRLGPDLSAAGATRSREVLHRDIRDPGAAVTPGYQAVTIVTHDNRQIRGVRKGEDAFSIQILDSRERLQGYLKADLTSVSREPRTLMPAYGADRLSDADLDDLLRFLSTVKGR